MLQRPRTHHRHRVVAPGNRPVTAPFCGWLPAIRCHSSTLWFPLATASVTAITDSVDRQSAAADLVADAMSVDPAFAIAASIQWIEATESVRASASNLASLTEIPLSRLAAHWCRHVRERWRTTDWLACPAGPDSQARWERCAELDRYFRTLPLGRWIEQSGVWIEASGGHAAASPLASHGSLVDDRRPQTSVKDQDASATHHLIARLVAKEDATAVTSDSLSTAIEETKRDLAHTLAYGLSHEINNPLANIATRAESLIRRTTDADQQGSLQRIIDQTYRAHAMIADLMFYANPPQPNQQSFDLRARIDVAIDSVSAIAFRRSIQIRFLVDENVDSLVATGDPEMIGDVVVSLIQNSIDAIGMDGTVEIHLTSIACEAEAKTWQIRVCDSGPGITAEQANKAFDPYFSGREAGRGLGLGLCRAQRIMELHEGTIELQPALAGCVATLCW